MWRQSDGDSFSRAVDNHEFFPYYQPVFDLMTGEIRVSDLDLSALSSGPVPAAKQTPEVAA